MHTSVEMEEHRKEASELLRAIRQGPEAIPPSDMCALVRRIDELLDTASALGLNSQDSVRADSDEGESVKIPLLDTPRRAPGDGGSVKASGRPRTSVPTPGVATSCESGKSDGSRL